MPAARQGGHEEERWNSLKGNLESLEKSHTAFAALKAKLARPDPLEQRWIGRKTNLDKVLKKGEEIVADIPTIINGAQSLVAAEEAKRAGVGGKVKGVLKGKAKKLDKARRLGQVQTLLVQLRQRLLQVRAETEG